MGGLLDKPLKEKGIETGGLRHNDGKIQLAYWLNGEFFQDLLFFAGNLY